MQIDKEISFLRGVSALLRNVGYTLLVISAIGILASFAGDYGDEVNIMLLISSLAVLPISAVFSLAFSGIINILIRIEFNTRNNEEPFHFHKREDRPIFQNRDEAVSFEEWKKDNLKKTRNDYYAMLRKKQ